MRRLAAVLVLTVSLGACAPRLAPTYRDYRVGGGTGPLQERLADAVTAAGWTVAASPDPAVVTTAPRAIAGTLAPMTAVLELVPLAGGHVRVWVRGETRPLLGGRTKVFALSPAARARVLGPVTEALAARGLVALDAPRERDEEAEETR